MTVDEFVQSKVMPEFRGVVEAIRRSMRELAPECQELVSYGLPAYKRNRILAVISPTKKDITLSFSRGIRFEDRYGLLRGSGKSSRHLKFKRVDQVEKELMRYYIRQAVDFDSQ
jgi:hypothetical protein